MTNNTSEKKNKPKSQKDKKPKLSYYLKDRSSDDITFCMAECRTACARKPVRLRYREHPHSFADFSNSCSSYKPTIQAVISTAKKD